MAEQPAGGTITFLFSDIEGSTRLLRQLRDRYAAVLADHRTLMRNGHDVSQHPLPSHPDDKSREDLVALDPGESVIVYRGFRTFVGPYVAHCHNLMHEDHAMMFGWTVTP